MGTVIDKINYTAHPPHYRYIEFLKSIVNDIVLIHYKVVFEEKIVEYGNVEIPIKTFTHLWVDCFFKRLHTSFDGYHIKVDVSFWEGTVA